MSGGIKRAHRHQTANALVAALWWLLPLPRHVFGAPVHGAELTAGVPSVAKPQEFKFGDVTVISKGTMVFGTIIRADDRDPELITQGNGAGVGVNGKARGGINKTTVTSTTTVAKVSPRFSRASSMPT